MKTFLQKTLRKKKTDIHYKEKKEKKPTEVLKKEIETKSRQNDTTYIHTIVNINSTQPKRFDEITKRIKKSLKMGNGKVTKITRGREEKRKGKPDTTVRVI